MLYAVRSIETKSVPPTCDWLHVSAGVRRTKLVTMVDQYKKAVQAALLALLQHLLPMAPSSQPPRNRSGGNATAHAVLPQVYNPTSVFDICCLGSVARRCFGPLSAVSIDKMMGHASDFVAGMVICLMSSSDKADCCSVCVCVGICGGVCLCLCVSVATVSVYLCLFSCLWLYRLTEAGKDYSIV